MSDVELCITSSGGGRNIRVSLDVPCRASVRRQQQTRASTRQAAADAGATRKQAKVRMRIRISSPLPSKPRSSLSTCVSAGRRTHCTINLPIVSRLTCSLVCNMAKSLARLQFAREPWPADVQMQQQALNGNAEGWKSTLTTVRTRGPPASCSSSFSWSLWHISARMVPCAFKPQISHQSQSKLPQK